METVTYNLGNGAVGRHIKSNRFNTSLIAFHFYLPLNGKTLTEDALIPYLLTSCSADYKTITELNRKLLELYGAEISCSVSKSGDYLHTKIGISVINSNFAYDNENMTEEATSLLASLIFNPSLNGNSFWTEDLEREKRKTAERIDNEINNKRAYARTRLNEIMFEGESYGKFIYGTHEELDRIDGYVAYNAWIRFISESSIQLNVVSNEKTDRIFDRVADCLSKFDRSNISETTFSRRLMPANDVKEITENMEITQGKLVMGFSSELSGNFRQALPLMLFNDVFGGGPYSRLFSNVREKLSLCYYCSAVSRRSKGYTIVDSGVEFDKAEQAEKAILNELSELKQGNLEDSVLESSKKAISDSLASYYDNPNALDAWYTRDICEDGSLTPELAISLIKAVTKEEIIKTAEGVKLHTVYRLMPKKGGNQDEN